MVNPFLGGNYKSQFSLFIYKRLISRLWFSNADVMADFFSCGSPENLPFTVTKCEGYGEMKKAFCLIREMIESIEENCIQERGNIRAREFCYVGKIDDSLSEMVAAANEARYKKDLNEYFQFCQDSAGFFPVSWIEHFFAGTLDIFQIKRRKSNGKEIIGTSASRKHKNIEWLPFIYECIRDKKVLHISYHEKFQVPTVVIFHPHFLKEFNGRWHIFGIIEKTNEENGEINLCEGYNIPLDRIDEKPKILKEGVCFKETNIIKYPEYFNDIVGVTKTQGMKLYTITLRIHDKYMFGLITTKPIHCSQETIMEYDNLLDYGEVRMTLRPNNEFYGRILQMGSSLEIISPQEVRDEITKRISDMSMRYGKKSNKAPA